MTRILVPPGIGDIYWTMVKLPAFLKKHGLSNPELTVVSYPDARGGHLRGIPYLELFDSITNGIPNTVPNDPALQTIWDEAYNGPGRSIIPDVMGYDYLMAYNGRVNSGGYIEDDDLECDWHPKMSDATERGIAWDAEYFKTQFGLYAVMFWPFYGTYESHLADFPLSEITKSLVEFFDWSGITPVFIGSAWDKDLNPRVAELIYALPQSIDLTGNISLVGTLGLLRSAKIVLGYHAGITNLAAAYGTKTLLLWDDRYPASTSYAVVPPDVRESTYFALNTKGLKEHRYFGDLCSLYEY